MRRSGVYALFVGAAVLVVTQHEVSRRLGEPYPALYLPSFRGVDEQDGVTSVRTLRVVATLADGSTREVSADELVDVDSLLHTAVLRHAFSDGLDAEGHPALPSVVRVQTRLVHGQVRGRTYADGRPIARSADTVEWLRQRVGRLLGRADVVAVTFVWSRVAATPSGVVRGPVEEQRVDVEMAGS